MSRQTTRIRPGSRSSVFTPARIAGLRAFADNGRARESNSTVPAGDVRPATVYWQTVRWLDAAGYIRPWLGERSGSWWCLTQAGLDQLNALSEQLELFGSSR